jgi:hypothetical protein
VRGRRRRREGEGEGNEQGDGKEKKKGRKRATGRRRRQATPHFMGHPCVWQRYSFLGPQGRDTRATSASQISIECSNPIKLFGSADSSGFDYGEMLTSKKFILFNVVTPARREMSRRYLDRRMTDGSLRQGLFQYI